mgnify:CR=1 FL=1
MKIEKLRVAFERLIRYEKEAEEKVHSDDVRHCVHDAGYYVVARNRKLSVAKARQPDREDGKTQGCAKICGEKYTSSADIF